MIASAANRISTELDPTPSQPLPVSLVARATAESAEASALPPAGASPAGDLQRRLSDAALLTFYSDRARSKTPVSRRRIGLAVVIGVTSWVGVFGLGCLLIL